MNYDPYAALHSARRDGWARLSPMEFTTPSAARLVEYASVRAGQNVLDVGCGTGTVAIAAERTGAYVHGLDPEPSVLEESRWKAAAAGASIEFQRGDVEALPFADGTFDVVLSQFGHIFAPHPDTAIQEMLRVLKPGGRLAFTTWPPELLMGQILALAERYLSSRVGIASCSIWGTPEAVRAFLGDSVSDIEFDRNDILIPTPNLQQYCSNIEFTIAPITQVVLMLAYDPVRLAEFRFQLEAVVAKWFSQNCVRQSYLLARAVKRQKICP